MPHSSSVVADESNDKSCASTAVGNAPSGSGSTIKAFRVENPLKMPGYAQDNATRMVELDVHKDAFGATYICSCRSEPLMRLVAIDRQRHQ
jgi:hypothetical protein